MQKFIIQLSVLTLVLVAAVMLNKHLLHLSVVHHHASLFIWVFAFITWFSFRVVERGTSKNPDNFTAYFMGSVVLRFFLCIGLFLAYLLLYSDTTLTFAFNFMILYFIFTGFEIYYIVRNLRPFSNNP